MASVTLVETNAETEQDVRPSPLWRVLLHNDDITTFDFVIELLRTVFYKDASEAIRLTNEVHETGIAVVTVTHRERAELYVDQVRSLARPRGFPLRATIEPE
jgi:ATP-dependent Clp protease adaptor protein ClpS